MEAQTKPDSSNKVLIEVIVIVSLLIDALILIYPLTQWANLGIIRSGRFDIGPVNITLPQEGFTT